jgi:hypothetical protein
MPAPPFRIETQTQERKAPLALNPHGLNRTKFDLSATRSNTNLKPSSKHVIEALGTGLPVKGAHGAVRIPIQQYRPLATRFDSSLIDGSKAG